jgi:hypothetical protein
MNQKIPFSFSGKAGIMSQKYPIAFALKSFFEKIIAKGKHRSSNFFNRGVPLIRAKRR